MKLIKKILEFFSSLFKKRKKMTLIEAQKIIQDLQEQAVRVAKEFDDMSTSKGAVIIEQGNKITALEAENETLKQQVYELQEQVSIGTQVPAEFASSLNGLAETMQVLDDKVPDAAGTEAIAEDSKDGDMPAQGIHPKP